MKNLNGGFVSERIKRAGMLSLEGQQLGNYDVIRRIRVGGMGAVYEGRQRTAFDRRVAIKVILGDYANDRDMRRRFAREAQTVARLHHPHILPLIEFGDERGILYLVMPFIDGGTLTSYLRRSLPDLGEVAAIYQQLLDAVEYAHEEGLIHRDIKSSNVLLEMRRSGPPYVYLADFGLVRTARRAGGEQTSQHEAVGKAIPLDQVPGTPHYMAPEQTRGIVTPQTDIYALGVLLFQMLTGELPYNADDDVRVIQMHLQAPIPMPSSRDASIPPELDEVVRMAMAKRPEARFRTVAELRRAFLSAIKGPVATPEPEPPLASSSGPPQHKSRMILPTELILPQARRERAQAMRRSASGHEHEAVPAQRRDPTPVRHTSAVKRPPRVHRRGLGLTVALAMMIPILLIVLLLMPRLLGISIFPAGFPLFGTPPVATLNITVQSQLVHEDYVITASPQVSTPDSSARVIPARSLQASAGGSRDVKTTGKNTIPAAQAQGSILFTNSGAVPYQVTTQLILTTNSGVQIQITQAATVEGHTKGKDGSANVTAIVVQGGIAGNIPANTLSGPCCNTAGVSASNPAAFTGGVDARILPTVNQLDIDGAVSSLSPDLQRRVDAALQKQLTPGDLAAGKTAYSVKIEPDQPVGAQTDHVTINVTISGALMVFNHDDATRMAANLLGQKAANLLDSHYHLQGSLIPGTPAITSQGPNNTIDLTVPVHGLWLYVPSTQQVSSWRQSIRGATLDAARAYLNTQPGIAHTDITLPFGTDHLPGAIEDITILLVNPGP